MDVNSNQQFADFKAEMSAYVQQVNDVVGSLRAKLERQERTMLTAWTAPAFDQMGVQPALARQMTEWLFSDPQGNPSFFDNPAKWPTNGVLRLINYTTSFSSLGDGESSTNNLDFLGGTRGILLRRTASVRSAASVADGNADYVTVREFMPSSRDTIQSAPLSMNFGTAQLPWVLPVPDFWYGNENRRVTVTNNTGVSSNIDLGYLMAVLVSGN